MRLATRLLAVVLVLTGAPAFAQQTSSTLGDNEAPLNLPVSLDKIREGLAQPPPVEPLKGLNDQ